MNENNQIYLCCVRESSGCVKILAGYGEIIVFNGAAQRSVIYSSQTPRDVLNDLEDRISLIFERSSDVKDGFAGTPKDSDERYKTKQRFFCFNPQGIAFGVKEKLESFDERLAALEKYDNARYLQCLQAYQGYVRAHQSV